jgi:UDPglucose--hexose-1-phosphate uridylyltransferase
MPDFRFILDPVNHRFVISAPKRGKVQGEATQGASCPFCYGAESLGKELFRVGPGGPDEIGWNVRVIANKNPFAPIHEVVIHSPHHHKDFANLPTDQVIKIIGVYRMRFQTNAGKGSVIIFNNHGVVSSGSLTHPHTQIAVIPPKYKLSTPRLFDLDNFVGESKHFRIYCPSVSEWPWEVWVVPKKRDRVFGRITDLEIEDFSILMPKVIKNLEEKLEKDFSFNFYLFPGTDWYWRIMPRVKDIGGFELATGRFVNTFDPQEAARYLKNFF